MRPLIERTSQIVLFIPYRKVDGRFEYYLQMRDEHAPVDANVYGMFGGHVEEYDSSMAATLARELNEELEYSPKKAQYFAQFARGRATFDVFIEEVEKEFESTTVVHEGRYGRFLLAEEILYSRECSLLVQLVIVDLDTYLKAQGGA